MSTLSRRERTAPMPLQAVPESDTAFDSWFDSAPLVSVRGRVVEAIGTLVRAVGIEPSIGDLCELRNPQGASMQAEVLGFREHTAVLMPFGPLAGLSKSTEVVPLRQRLMAPTGVSLLGRVLDGFGRPIDGQGPLGPVRMVPVEAMPPDPLHRRPVERLMPTGVNVIDSMVSVGEGQRLGVFAAAGAGKSTLAGMLARGADCDVNVIALVGERGREVNEFIEHSLQAEGMARSVVVVATSDKSAAERIKAAFVATAIAEGFRSEGLRVLFIMDSATRFARALREVGLASGEPPTRRGYPPSVFSMLPSLLERAGNDGHGSITAFYTVLTEGEDDDDPIAEEVRSILDGHLVLSKKLAQSGQYPAVDALASVSRVMTLVASKRHQQAATRMRALISKYRDIELLLQVGEYKAGADPQADAAVAKMPAIRAFLTQPAESLSTMQFVEDTLYEIAGAQP